MKKLLVLTAALTLLASPALAVITGSAHDFQAETWSGGEICAPCHTPHNADTAITDSPLWNHENTGVTFALYAGFDLNATDLNQPGTASKLCLSCHDGTVALDSFGGTAGTELIGTNYNSADLGNSLTNDHPIGFTYDTALATADGGLFNPAATSSGLTGGTTITADLLFDNKLECASCHDVHDGGEDAGTQLLVKSNTASALCLTCHNK